MAARRDPGRDLDQVQGHRLCIAPRQHQPSRLALDRADRTEDVGGRGPLVLRCAGPRAALGPAPGNFVLLPNPGLVSEPHLYVAGIEALRAGDCCHRGAKAFLKAATAPSAWAWWRGRADSLR